ncbi:aminoglycoside phosphotransferase family protein [Halobacillus sp. A5]|uniref:aminoglycoside phosphotransferase family protein n=1 Tax=Halobacillus sp. A5 TaxID=2880263 RepID=UPI0020A6A22B|nr:aminoglycoside phosphotransferase family protein [Halobacillus sp. A5]MCP3029212.1 aminoglycoside phosphotransferase family protein [Halobacillus sp. A5]
MDLPQPFADNVLTACPTEGEAWLKKIPELLRYSEQRWALTVHDPFPLSYNYVAPATSKKGAKVVLKLSLPEEGFEREALLALNPAGRVKVIDEDKEKGILLLEKVEPGMPLSELKDDEAATLTAARLHKQLVTAVRPDSPLPTIKGRENQLRDILMNNSAGLGPISNQTLSRALALFTYLNQTSKTQAVLHGDFHHYNILKQGENEWTAIDPKGLIGEIEYDLIQFLLNRWPAERQRDCINERIKIFVQELNLNKERLLLWGYCHTVLAASWTVNQHGGYDEDFYSAIEIFRSLYECTYQRTIEGAID